eukprot:7037163-Lingulodinium_polyedra.AAC.1
MAGCPMPLCGGEGGRELLQGSVVARAGPGEGGRRGRLLASHAGGEGRSTRSRAGGLYPRPVGQPSAGGG